MNRQEIEDAYRNIIADQLAVTLEEVTDDAIFLDTLNADSLDDVEIVMQLEDKFDIEIPDEEAERWVTVGDGLRYLTNELVKGHIGN